MLATDGSHEVIGDLKSNIHLNELKGSGLIQAAILQWGHALIGGVADCRGEDRFYDLVLGADVVSVSTCTNQGRQALCPSLEPLNDKAPS